MTSERSSASDESTGRASNARRKFDRTKRTPDQLKLADLFMQSGTLADFARNVTQAAGREASVSAVYGWIKRGAIPRRWLIPVQKVTAAELEDLLVEPAAPSHEPAVDVDWLDPGVLEFFSDIGAHLEACLARLRLQDDAGAVAAISRVVDMCESHRMYATRVLERSGESLTDIVRDCVAGARKDPALAVAMNALLTRLDALGLPH